jgi:cytochrome oxidase Cu insertion factor (SCO1/SenC/PrrC family)
MRQRLPIVLLSLAAALSGGGCRCGAGAVPEPVRAGLGVDAAPGEKAPPLELTGLDGKPISLASLHGQVVAVNFWATWCPPCREEMPSMIALGKDLAARHPGRFKMVAVSLDEKADTVRDYLEALGADAGGVSVAMDTADQSTTTAFYCAARAGCPDDYKLPETYIVDGSGRLVGYVVGPRDWSTPAAREYFEQLLR